MEIVETRNGKEVTLKLIGRLDTQTAPQLSEKFQNDDGDVEGLVLDLSDLEYISSAGLRVVLSLDKLMSKRGGMVVTGARDTVMEVFEATGFMDILEIR